MKNFLIKTWNTLFSKELELRIKVFNVIALTGTVICLAMAVLSVATEMISGIFINLAAAAVSMGILIYSLKTGKYQLCYTITIIFVFFLLFPILFVTGGGIEGGMPFFFVFAIVYTVYMLEGWWMVFITTAELILYTMLSIYAFYCPEHIHAFATAQMSLVDMVSGFLTVSVSLGATLYAQLHLYQAQQKELIHARETAQAANQAKSAFLANMSHEIRTPIHLILGMNEMIHRESETPQIREYSAKIEKAGNMLLTLVDNVLDVYKIESGKMELMLDQYKTEEIVDMLNLVGTTRCQEKGITFYLNTENLTPVLYGDCVHIKRIAINLLSNAIKYTSKGSVHVDIYEKPATDPSQTVFCLSVSDTGIGIRKEVLPTLFNAFTRADLANHRYIEGTGLGLAIVRELVNLMQGKIHVNSVYGQGSNFTVEIPQIIVKEEMVDPAESEMTFIAPEARILVVDDHQDNRETMKALLACTQMQVDTAESGMVCLQKVQKYQYHLILMDYMMDEMDGIETMRNLQKIENFNVPVIALTANVIAGTQQKLLNEGFSAYVAKPVPWKKLQKTLIDSLPKELVYLIPVSRAEKKDCFVSQEVQDQLENYGLNLKNALDYFNDDLNQCAHTAAIFLKYDQDQFAKAQQLAIDGNCADLLFIVHAMKGKTGNIGLRRLNEVTGLMENLCRDNKKEEMQSLAPYLFYWWKQGSKALKILAGLYKTENQIEQEVPLQSLPVLLHQMQRQPSLNCLDQLLKKETDPEILELLKETADAVTRIDFDQAEILAQTILKKKGGNDHDIS